MHLGSGNDGGMHEILIVVVVALHAAACSTSSLLLFLLAGCFRPASLALHCGYRAACCKFNPERHKYRGSWRNLDFVVLQEKCWCSAVCDLVISCGLID